MRQRYFSRISSMNSARLKRLQAAGWKIGSTKDFLKLSDEEAMLVELKLSPNRRSQAGAPKAPFVPD